MFKITGSTKILAFIVWALMQISFPSRSFALPENLILKSDFRTEKQFESIEIIALKEPSVKTFRLENPHRLVIDFADTFTPDIHSISQTNGELILRYRIGQNTKNKTRLVLFTEKHHHHDIHIRQKPNGRYRLSVRLTKTTDPFSFKKISQKQRNIIQPVLVAWLNPDITSMIKAHSDVKTTDIMLAGSPMSEGDATPLKDAADQSSLLIDDTEVDESIFEENGDLEKDKWRFSGEIKSRVSLDTDDNQPNENVASFKNRTIIEIGYENTFVLSGLSDYLYFGSHDSTDDYNLDIYEAYYRDAFGALNWSLGKQIKRWGKTDQISPIDTLNPQNLTEFIIPDYEERKIPVWMAELSYKKDNFFIETFFIPFFEPAKLDYFGTDWAIFTHIKSDLNDSTALSPSLKNYFNSIRVNEDEPTRDPDSFEYAARIGGTIKDVDIGFTYHYTTEDNPHFTQFPVKNLALDNPSAVDDLLASIGSLTLTNEDIEVEFLRTQIFGFEFETTLEKIGLRGEAAYSENTSFLTDSFTSKRQPTLFYILGMDYSGENSLYVNFQFGHQHITHYDSSILYFERDNYSFIGQVKKDIWDDWLTADLKYTYMLNDDSYYVSPRLIYSYIDNLSIILGLNLFEGSDNSIFGRYDRNDQILLDVSYQF